MNIFKIAKKTILDARNRSQENTFDSILWIVNVVPTMCGFSYIKEGNVSAWFWIIHLSLLLYVYVLGCFWFQWTHVMSAGDFVKSYFSISVTIIVANISWWFIVKRPLLQSTLKKIDQNDQLAFRSVPLRYKHKQLMKTVKRIVYIFYGFNYFDGFFIYFPHRINVENTYSMTSCVGMDVTDSPSRDICLTLLFAQELTINLVALNYQALLLFLIAHTAAMYQMMAYELIALSENCKKENKEYVKETLSSLVERHSLTMEVVDRLKSLYSVPIGVNFFTNAVCISLFFYLPFREWLQFMPLLVYFFLVFFLYCFLGQRLVNSSEVFERAVYCCGWENFDTKEKKLVFVMLRQSQKKVELLAADIIPVNIYTFATTLRAMFKFITVVKF